MASPFRALSLAGEGLLLIAVLVSHSLTFSARTAVGQRMFVLSSQTAGSGSQAMQQHAELVHAQPYQ